MFPCFGVLLSCFESLVAVMGESYGPYTHAFLK